VKTALPARGGAAASGSRRPMLLAIFAAIVVAVVLRSCFFNENDFEKIAREVTAALQRDDLATVVKYQNAETATEVNRERVGRASDALAPLGSLKSVKETNVDADKRIHDFTVTFDKGTLHETIKFDPQKKIVGFHYDPPTRK